MAGTSWVMLHQDPLITDGHGSYRYSHRHDPRVIPTGHTVMTVGSYPRNIPAVISCYAGQVANFGLSRDQWFLVQHDLTLPSHLSVRPARHN